MSLEKISLFSSKKDFFIFLLVCAFIFSYALLIQYNNYKNLTQFDSQLVTATVIKQYIKTKTTKKGKLRQYHIVKFKTNKGAFFYTTKKKDFPQSQGKTFKVEIWAENISFYNYLTNFFAYSRLLTQEESVSTKEHLNKFIANAHGDKDITSIYKALYTANSLPQHLQEKFSSLGISHLLAISGFHLGVLSALLFFIFKTPYKFFQNRYFPFRSYRIDSFIVISIVLLTYLLFLDSPPSLLRAYVMLVIGFIFYDRGFKILSMQTLLLTVIIILSFSPRLLFSLGFWLSVWGVFYIFLFLIHFKHLSKLIQFLLVPIWVYLMMIPLSLFIFENFSLYHPFSIIFTSLFTLFYPLSILFHLIGFGSIFDNSLLWVLNLNIVKTEVPLHIEVIAGFLFVSLLSVWKKYFVYLLLLFALSIFIYAIDNVA